MKKHESTFALLPTWPQTHHLGTFTARSWCTPVAVLASRYCHHRSNRLSGSTLAKISVLSRAAVKRYFEKPSQALFFVEQQQFMAR